MMRLCSRLCPKTFLGKYVIMLVPASNRLTSIFGSIPVPQAESESKGRLDNNNHPIPGFGSA
jgi:hypothetical protein